MALHSADVMGFSWGALRGYPVRTLLMLLAMSIGVGAVVILTALGDGARQSKLMLLHTNHTLCQAGLPKLNKEA